MKAHTVTDTQIKEACEQYNFGSADTVAMVKLGLLAIAGPYRNGHSVSTILADFGLITRAPHFNITMKGRRQLYEWYSDKYQPHPKLQTDERG